VKFFFSLGNLCKGSAVKDAHSLPKSMQHQSALSETVYYSAFPMKIVTLEIFYYLCFSIKSMDDYMKISCDITSSSFHFF